MRDGQINNPYCQCGKKKTVGRIRCINCQITNYRGTDDKQDDTGV